MGMTIDDAITWLNTDDFESKGFADATSVAIDTMRKYQKIQEIINNAKDSDGAVKYNWLYEQIKEVMEDGTD